MDKGEELQAGDGRLKINDVSDENFKNEKNIFSLKRLARNGIIAFSTLMAVSGSVGCDKVDDDNELNSMIGFVNNDVSLDDINDMKILLNDGDCSDSFFNAVCSKLRDDGIKFSVTKNNKNIDGDNGVLITLDQQYSSGADTIIFAPYNNTRLGYSDSLALSMRAAFDQNGFMGNKIVCGKVGYREDNNGNVVSLIPTETEESLDEDSDISFVTLSFGTQNINAEWVAKSIENGLARQKYFLENYDTASDLIYRASSNDSVEIIADYFRSDTDSFIEFNNISIEQPLLESQTIINPNVGDMVVFDRDSEFNIDGEIRTKAY